MNFQLDKSRLLWNWRLNVFIHHKFFYSHLCIIDNQSKMLYIEFYLHKSKFCYQVDIQLLCINLKSSLSFPGRHSILNGCDSSIKSLKVVLWPVIPLPCCTNSNLFRSSTFVFIPFFPVVGWDPGVKTFLTSILND